LSKNVMTMTESPVRVQVPINKDLDLSNILHLMCLFD
jgi:hypothetical protein